MQIYPSNIDLERPLLEIPLEQNVSTFVRALAFKVCTFSR